MKKSENIIKKVASEVKAEMVDSISQGCDWMVFEQEINGVPVKVEIREVRLRNGYYIDWWLVSSCSMNTSTSSM